MKDLSVFKTRTDALIYARLIEYEGVTHFTTDNHFDLYVKIRKEIPKIVIICDTRKELVSKLEAINYYA